MSFVAMAPNFGPDIECIDCGQKIHRVVNRKHPDYGWVLNAETREDLGGIKNERHECPHRLKMGSVYYESLAKKLRLCKRCMNRFSGVFSDCPFCFIAMCAYEDCKSLRQLRFNGNNRCWKCGRQFVIKGYVSKYDPEQKKYVKCDFTPDQYDPVYFLDRNDRFVMVNMIKINEPRRLL